MDWLLAETESFLRRYWIEAQDIIDNKVLFKDELFHHIFDVCRQVVGSKFEVITSGSAYFVEVIAVSKKGATAQILEKREIQPLAKPLIKLAICVPRFPVLESVVEKAVEMGVSEIQLLSSDYSFIKKSEKISDGKWERWLKIIKSATQQSGRGDLMALHSPISLNEWMKSMNPDGSSMCLFGYEGEKTMGAKEYLNSQNKSGLESAWILVGGEGGFSTQEVASLQESGCQAVTLGAQVLRVETACIAMISILKYEMNLMRGFQ